jgi:hypothetical protein
MGRVKRDSGKVWIDGVPDLNWGTRRECTFCGAFEAALAVTDQPHTYTNLMGYTAQAFRVRWYKGHTGQTWCPSSPCGEFPDEIAAAQKATGWRFRMEMRLDQENPDMADLAPDIVASIDKGVPVIGYEPGLNAGVIYGYENNGEMLLMRDYMTRDSDTLCIAPSKLGAFLIMLQERTVPPSRRDAIVEGLGLAVTNARRDPMQAPKGQYHYGDAALSEWAGDIAKAGDLSEGERKNLFFVSWWNYTSLHDARLAGAVFLRDAASVLPAAADALRAAADAYGKQAEHLGRAFDPPDAFFGWSGKSIDDWTDDVRKREHDVLVTARELDAAGIGAIEKVLAAAGASEV